MGQCGKGSLGVIGIVVIKFVLSRFVYVDSLPTEERRRSSTSPAGGSRKPVLSASEVGDEGPASTSTRRRSASGRHMDPDPCCPPPPRDICCPPRDPCSEEMALDHGRDPCCPPPPLDPCCLPPPRDLCCPPRDPCSEALDRGRRRSSKNCHHDDADGTDIPMHGIDRGRDPCCPPRDPCSEPALDRGRRRSSKGHYRHDDGGRDSPMRCTSPSRPAAELETSLSGAHRSGHAASRGSSSRLRRGGGSSWQREDCGHEGRDGDRDGGSLERSTTPRSRGPCCPEDRDCDSESRFSFLVLHYLPE